MAGQVMDKKQLLWFGGVKGKMGMWSRGAIAARFPASGRAGSQDLEQIAEEQQRK